MSMSIGQLMKSLVGEAQPGEGKALELKVGQTVRGVLVKMTGDHEGIVQINGTPVHAKLETPLTPGQAVLLQVQPESADAAVVLKQADPKAGALPEASVKEWIQALGLPDTKAAADLVRDLRRDGVVLTRDLASQFKAALAAMPEGGDAQSWMQAAALAAKRGLPMTGATIGALQQVLAGPPAHALLEALEAGLAAWSGVSAGTAADGAAQPPGAAQAAAAKLQALLSEGAALMRAGGGDSPPVGAAGAGGTAAEPVSPGAAGAAAAPAARSAAAPPPATTASADATMPEAAAGADKRAAASANGLPRSAGVQAGVGQAVQGEALDAEATSGSGAAMRTGGAALLAGTSGLPEQADTAAATKQTVLPEGAPGGQQRTAGLTSEQQSSSGKLSGQTQKDTVGNTPAAAVGNRPLTDSTAVRAAEGRTAQEAPRSATGGSWVGQIMKWMGVDHERMLATSAIMDPPKPRSSMGDTAASHGSSFPDQQMQDGTKAAGGQPEGVPGSRVAAMMLERNLQQAAFPSSSAAVHNQAALNDDGTPVNAAETLKSALMAIAASDDAPQQLRDTAQQVVAHITGQQLLLTPEKNGALFSHVSLFIPMKGPDGGQTASVHIQTRRGRKGELDGENCRLVFDLRMNNLGDTVVDVQVVNKIVNLHVWNDHPATARLVDAARNELSEAMTNAGYQLLTLRVDEMPDRIVDRLNGASGLAATADGQDWSTKPYKGVDLRV